MTHRKEPETHDFFSYRTRKSDDELDEIRCSKKSGRIKDQSQRQPCLWGNQAIGGLNESVLPMFGQERQPAFTALALMISYLPTSK